MATIEIDQSTALLLLSALGTQERRLNRLVADHGDTARGREVAAELAAVHEARDAIRDALPDSMVPAVTSPPETRAIAEFFASSGAVAAFVNEYQVGANPWGSALDQSGNLVVATPERDVLYVISPGGDAYQAIAYNDALEAMDAHSGELGRSLSGSGFASLDDAFSAVLADAELDLAAAPRA